MGFLSDEFPMKLAFHGLIPNGEGLLVVAETGAICPFWIELCQLSPISKNAPNNPESLSAFRMDRG